MKYKILSIVLFGLLIASVTLWLSRCNSDRKIIDDLQGQLRQQGNDIDSLHSFYLAWLDSCEQAHVVDGEVTIVERWYPGKVIRVPAAVDSVLIQRTLNTREDADHIFVREYTGRAEFEDLTAYYRAKVAGALTHLEITSYMVNEKHTQSTAVITKPSPPQKPKIEYVYRRGWYVTAAAGNDLSSWRTWNSLEGGIGYMTRKGISFGADYQYYVHPHNDERLKGQFAKIRMSYFFGK